MANKFTREDDVQGKVVLLYDYIVEGFNKIFGPRSLRFWWIVALLGLSLTVVILALGYRLGGM